MKTSAFSILVKEYSQAMGLSKEKRLPGSWADDTLFSLEEAPPTTLEIKEVGGKLLAVRPVAWAKAQKEAERKDRELLDQAFAALDKFAHETWVRSRAKVREEKNLAREREKAIAAAKRKARIEKAQELENRMREHAINLQKSWAAAAARLRARVIHKLSVNGKEIQVPVILPGIAASRVTASKWRKRAEESWIRLHSTYVSSAPPIDDPVAEEYADVVVAG